jgi:hypothetical protein
VSPYWGDKGVSFAWNLASIPGTAFEALGGDADVLSDIAEVLTTADPAPTSFLLATVRSSLETAVDLLCSVAGRHVDADKVDALADLSIRLSSYAVSNPNPAWLSEVGDDASFLARLVRELERWEDPGSSVTAGDPSTWESLGGLSGVWNFMVDAGYRISEGVSRLKVIPGNAATRAILPCVRRDLSEVMMRFLGDVFVYLKGRGESTRFGEIVQRISDGIDKARADAHAEDTKLIVMCHSMGANILYDLLTHYRTDLAVDCWITVGAQVAPFEEMKLYHASDKAVHGPLGKVPKPTSVTRWINIFDPNDPLSFAAGTVFGDVQDLQYATGTSALGAHGMYFRRPSFYRRLADRL